MYRLHLVRTKDKLLGGAYEPAVRFNTVIYLIYVSYL